MIFYPFIIFLLCYIAYVDITKRKIFNWLSIIIVLIAFYCFDHKPDSVFSDNLTESFFCSIAVFILFFVFYLLNFMGAGDVKLGASLAFLMGYEGFFYSWVVSVFILFCFFSTRGFFYHLNGGLFFLNDLFLFQKVGKIAPYGAFLSLGVAFVILRGVL